MPLPIGDVRHAGWQAILQAARLVRRHAAESKTIVIKQTATPRPPWQIYIALLVAGFVASAGITVIYNMLTTLYRHFPGENGVGWVVTIYWLASAVAAAVCGRLGDVFGRRRVMLIVLVLCSLGAILSALTSNLLILIAGCAIQGIAAAITPLVYGIARENLHDDQLAFAVGIIVAGGMIGAGVVYLLSGIVIDHYSWQGGFWFKVALAAAAFTLVLVWIPDSRPRPGPPIHLARGLLFAPGLCAILIAVQKLGTWGLADWRIWGLTIGGILVLATWGRDQWRQENPLINVRSLTHRPILVANLCMVFLALGGLQLGQVFSLFFQQPSWTNTGLGLSATTAGAIMLMLTLTALLGGPWSGRIAKQKGARNALLTGMAVIATAWGSLMLWHHRTAFVIGFAILCSLGLSIAQAGIYNLIVEATPRERTAEATGLTYVFLACFFAVGAQNLFAILGSNTVTDVAHGAQSFPSDVAFGMSFGYVSLMAVTAFLIALAVPRKDAPVKQARPARISVETSGL